MEIKEDASWNIVKKLIFFPAEVVVPNKCTRVQNLRYQRCHGLSPVIFWRQLSRTLREIRRIYRWRLASATCSAVSSLPHLRAHSNRFNFFSSRNGDNEVNCVATVVPCPRGRSLQSVFYRRTLRVLESSTAGLWFIRMLPVIQILERLEHFDPLSVGARIYSILNMNISNAVDSRIFSIYRTASSIYRDTATGTAKQYQLRLLERTRYSILRVAEHFKCDSASCILQYFSALSVNNAFAYWEYCIAEYRVL